MSLLNLPRVLVVDDDSSMREQVSAFLMSEGYQVTACSNAEEAFSAANTRAPDLVITDVILPGMDGYALCRQLRQHPPTRTVPVLILTSKGDTSDKVAGFQAGADDYLTKPFQPPELGYRARALLARRQIFSEPAGTTTAKRGRVIMFFGARGGVGKTTIAVNTAVALRRRTNRRVLLLDADFFFGSLGVHLNLPPVRSILDLIPQANELNPDVLKRAMSPHGSGLHVLLSPFQPEEAERITADFIRSLLDYLVTQYDEVIVDSQVSYDDRTLAILEKADQIMLVTVPELSAIITTRLFLELSEKLGLQEESIQLVLNRSDSNVGLEAVEIERALRHRVAFKVVSGGRPVVQSVNKGTPLVVQQPSHPFSQHISRIVEYFA